MKMGLIAKKNNLQLKVIARSPCICYDYEGKISLSNLIWRDYECELILH